MYKITKKLIEIKNLIKNNNLGEILKKPETIRLIEFSVLNLSCLIEYLSEKLKEKYLAKEWGKIYNLGHLISRNEIDFDGVWYIINKNFTKFELLIDSIIKTENYDFTEQERLEEIKRIYDLNDKFNTNNLNACQEEPLKDKEIPEINPEESRKYGRFKIETINYGNEEDGGEYSIVEYLCLKEEDKWKQLLYNIIKGRDIDYEHGKISEYLDYPLQRVIYIDIEDLIYYIENEIGMLYCSIDKFRWYRYNVELKERPYYNRIEKLRKFKIPN